MEAAAHTKGGFAGVPQGVGKEFIAADKARDAQKGSESKRPLPKSTKGYGR
jgi:hypothetical protein